MHTQFKILYFSNVNHNLADAHAFAEGDEPLGTVRCQACLILSKCYLLDLPLRLRAQPCNQWF